MSFVDALKIWNKDKESYCIPRKNTQGYKEVIEIMNNLPKVTKGLPKKEGKGLKRLGGKGMTRLGGGCMKCEMSAAEEKKVHKLGMGLRRLGYSYEKPQKGGFFPALLAMLPALSTVGSAAGSALAGATAGKLIDGISNIASGKNFFTGQGHGNGCYCHHLVKNPHFNKCKRCAGVTGGNIMDIVPFFIKQVEAISKNPFVKESLKQGKKLANVDGLESVYKSIVKGSGMKKKKK